MENMEEITANAAFTLTETVLGAAVVLLVVLLFFVMKLVFDHIKASDERWANTVQKNTDALRDMTTVQKESGDKIAVSIERALLYSRSNDNHNGS